MIADILPATVAVAGACLSGRWLVRDGLIVTAVTCPAAAGSAQRK